MISLRQPETPISGGPASEECVNELSINISIALLCHNMSLKVYKSEKMAIGLVLAAVGGVGIVVGMSFPLLTLLMEREGFSASLIGLNSATGSLGILIVGLFTAKVLGRYGAFMPIIVAALVGAGSLIALPLVGYPAGWFILRFLLTVGVGLLWLLSESWLNMLTSDGNRGRIIGLYAVLFSAGFALGPLVVSVTGSHGLVPFAITAVVMAGSAVPMLMLARRGASAQETPVRRFTLLMLAPFIFVVAFAGGL
ncbi:MAG TPA: MFS transporter, partial [Rhodospirillales bacterium]|nr:MFS transporter [Rhodospirillales bacterium]